MYKIVLIGTKCDDQNNIKSSVKVKKDPILGLWNHVKGNNKRNHTYLQRGGRHLGQTDQGLCYAQL